MVFLYSHNSFNLPIDYLQGNFYKSSIGNRKSFSSKKRVRELTSANRKFLISLGFKLK